MSKTAVKEAAAVMSIPLERISVSSLEPQERRRRHFNDEEIAELAESIRSMGLISPITVRPYNMTPVETAAGTDYEPTYELVAGERRYLATKLAGLASIEAVVRQLDDQQAIEIQLHENLKRREVEPLDEAYSYRYLIEHAQVLDGGVPRPYTVADIAAKFARTEELILRRLKLVDLCDEGKQDLADGYLPLAHAELIARFPETTQKSLLKKQVYRWNEKDKGALPLKDVRDSIERNNASFILSKAKFDREDASLRKDGLVCLACPNRTGYAPKLFADTKLSDKDTCLDAACFTSKLRTMLAAKREKLAGELPNPKNLPLKDLVLQVPLVKKEGSDYYGHRDISIGKGVYLVNNWNKKTYNSVKSKTECEHVEKALRVGGDGIGATTLICRSSKCKKHSLKSGSSGSSGYDYEADRLKREEHQLNVKIADAVRTPLIAKKAQQFSATKWIFDGDEGRRFLLATILAELGREVSRTFRPFGDLVPTVLIKNEYSDKDYFKIVADFDMDTVSRLLALYCFRSFGESDWSNVGDQTKVRELADEFGENYDLLAAKARVSAVPETHRLAAQAHLEAIEAGKPSKPPTVYWPRKKEKEEKPATAKKAAKGGK